MYLAGSSRNEGQSSSTTSTAPEGKVVHVLHALMLLNRVCSGTMLPPPISSQQWHNFLLKILPFLHPESIDVAAQLESTTSTHPPQPAGKGKQRAKGPVKSRTKKSNSYLDQILLKDGQVDKVVFYDTTIQLGTEEELENALTPDVTKEILWELCHMSF